MPGFEEELENILLLPEGELRDDELFAFVERRTEADPEVSVKAATCIGEKYKRGWALLLCVKALVHTDIGRARKVAELIEDEYNQLRAKQTIEFTIAKLHKKSGFDPSWN